MKTNRPSSDQSDSNPYHRFQLIHLPYSKIFLTALVVVTLVAVNGCYLIDLPLGSMGPKVSSTYAARGVDFNAFRLTYDNWLEFDHDLTVSVDSLFSRILAGDQDAKKLARDFVQPGFRVLANNFRIVIPTPEPIANPGLRRFQFETSSPNWSQANRNGDSPITKVFQDTQDGNRYRWKAAMSNSYIEFNPLTPKRVLFHFELEVQLQIQSKSAEFWQYPLLDQKEIDNLRFSIGTKLLNTYNAYLKDNFGVNVTSPAFHHGQDY